MVPFVTNSTFHLELDQLKVLKQNTAKVLYIWSFFRQYLWTLWRHDTPGPQHCYSNWKSIGVNANQLWLAPAWDNTEVHCLQLRTILGAWNVGGHAKISDPQQTLSNSPRVEILVFGLNQFQICLWKQHIVFMQPIYFFCCNVRTCSSHAETYKKSEGTKGMCSGIHGWGGGVEVWSERKDLRTGMHKRTHTHISFSVSLNVSLSASCLCMSFVCSSNSEPGTKSLPYLAIKILVWTKWGRNRTEMHNCLKFWTLLFILMWFSSVLCKLQW